MVPNFFLTNEIEIKARPEYNKSVVYIKKISNPKQSLLTHWNSIKSGSDWKILEEFGLKLLSYLSEKNKVLAFRNLKREGNETDGIICINSTLYGKRIVLEAKCYDKVTSTHVDQLKGRMEDHNIKLGFLLTNGKLTAKHGAMSSIARKNSKGINIIVPLQGQHILDFLQSNQDTKDFLEEKISIATTDVQSLKLD